MHFHRLQSAQDPFYTDAFALYQISFPTYEQRTGDKQAALMDNPLYHFDVIVEDGAFSGILLYWELSGYTYIEHFAIHPEKRGKSLGSRSLSGFCGDHERIVLEIDPPVDPVSVRREGFYQKLGFEPNTHAHAHPAYHAQFAPHQLKVMSYPARLTEDEYALFRTELSCIVMRDVGID